ncbi:pepsin-like aspartic protease [Aliiglaciecola sp. CAU 1673]|uniref:pepsin-like aspartic protease n=1 Tax=Aliiglaciecola sp. CAU 1673 TaxID=3032595 RepID=UPI0023DB1E5F|nr:pepsin-like aspartic protease [Aliiglaciecola sp. CAU 1673]MDF2179412.1 pepsin-like aspartic protease [Aliiglaciecola sp. CAU 1673]
MPHSVRVPLVNVFTKGGYSARVHIGHPAHPANLVLDTGSSTLVVSNHRYQPESDKSLKASTLAQDVRYGKGGWYGPLIQTKVGIGLLEHAADLNDVHVAVTAKEQAGSFGQADGIMGLAYAGLNPAYDISAYLQQQQVSPLQSYPYLMSAEHQAQSVSDYLHFLHQYPRDTIQPYFSQLEEQGVVGNQFALLTHRSSIYQTDKERSQEQLAAHPLNHGLFVLGKPKLHRDLYQGEPKTIKVLDDKYYNVNLLSMQVGEAEPIAAPPLDAKDIQGYRTNAIVDSGASIMVLPSSLFSALLTALTDINADFATLLKPFETFTGEEVGIDMAGLDLTQWPPIHFTFAGERAEPVTLTMSPDTYWQVHAPKPNQAYFKFTQVPGWPNQTIVGLPFLNNYYSIFDRSEDTTGVIHFAQKAPVPAVLQEHLVNTFSS